MIDSPGGHHRDASLTFAGPASNSFKRATLTALRLRLLFAYGGGWPRAAELLRQAYRKPQGRPEPEPTLLSAFPTQLARLLVVAIATLAPAARIFSPHVTCEALQCLFQVLTVPRDDIASQSRASSYRTTRFRSQRVTSGDLLDPVSHSILQPQMDRAQIDFSGAWRHRPRRRHLLWLLTSCPAGGLAWRHEFRWDLPGCSAPSAGSLRVRAPHRVRTGGPPAELIGTQLLNSEVLPSASVAVAVRYFVTPAGTEKGTFTGSETAVGGAVTWTVPT
jgi:hypothetical protein